MSSLVANVGNDNGNIVEVDSISIFSKRYFQLINQNHNCYQKNEKQVDYIEWLKLWYWLLSIYAR